MQFYFRNLWLIIVSSFLLSQHVISQRDSLSYTINSYGIFNFKNNDIEVPKREFYRYLAKNDPAFQMFKSGKTNITVSTTLSYVGGFLIGWNIGDYLFRKKKGFTTGLIGCALVGVSFPIYYGGIDKTNKALKMYHDDILPTVIPNEPNIEVSDERKMIDESCIIVRVPVSGGKINYLKNKLKSDQLSEKTKKQFSIQLDETLEENNAYFTALQDAFANNFSIKKVLFIPDTLFRSLLDGQKTGFLNDKGSLDQNLQCESTIQYFFIAGKDKDQLLFVDHSLNKMPYPFPYKKQSFFPSFQKIFDRKKFLEKQVIFFNAKLSAI